MNRWIWPWPREGVKGISPKGAGGLNSKQNFGSVLQTGGNCHHGDRPKDNSDGGRAGGGVS